MADHLGVIWNLTDLYFGPPTHPNPTTTKKSAQVAALTETGLQEVSL